MSITEKAESFTYAFNGRDYEFVGQLEVYLEELLCPICMGLVNEPVQTSCGHLFCEGCLNQPVRGSPMHKKHAMVKRSRVGTPCSLVCPICQQNSTSHRDTFTERRVMNLRVKCTNRDQGCEWAGTLGDAPPHLQSTDGCHFEDVACSLNCDSKGPRNELRIHVAEHCPNRRHCCQHCGHEDTYQIVTEHHYGICQSYPVTCPNSCHQTITNVATTTTTNVATATTYPRSDLPRHLSEECPEERVQCPYKVLGCEEVVARRSLSEHLSAGKDIHLAQAMSTVVGLTERVEAIEECLGPQLQRGQPQVRQPQALQPQAQQRQDLQPQVRQPQACQPQALQPQAQQRRDLQPQIRLSQACQPQALQPQAQQGRDLQPQIRLSQALQPQIRLSQACQPQALQPQAQQRRDLQPQIRLSQALRPQIRLSQACQPQIRQPQACQPQIRQPQALQPSIRLSQACLLQKTHQSHALQLQARKQQLLRKKIRSYTVTSTGSRRKL